MRFIHGISEARIYFRLENFVNPHEGKNRSVLTFRDVHVLGIGLDVGFPGYGTSLTLGNIVDVVAACVVGFIVFIFGVPV